MNLSAQITDHKRNPIYWLVLVLSSLGLLLLLVPLEVMVQVGVQVSPLGTLQDKTILLFRALKITLPIWGITGIIWLHIPIGMRQGLAKFISHVTSSPWVMPTILVLALLLRIGWVFYYPTQPYAESAWYFNKASELASGYGYVYDLETRKPTAAWPVGYPLFLAIFFRLTGPSMPVAKLVNVALSVFCVYLTYLFALRTFDRGVAVSSALFMALLPEVIVYNSLICSDVLCMTLPPQA